MQNISSRYWLKKSCTKILVSVCSILALAVMMSSSASAITASGGGCGSYKLFSLVGLNLKACIRQDADKNIHADSYMTYQSTSKSVYHGDVEIEIWTYSSTSDTSPNERRARSVIDVTYYINKRPRPSYDREKSGWVDANPGQVLRSRARLCVKTTSTSSRTCSSWSYSPYQVAGS